ncbi:MAG TPA: carboxypeptidase regulatory-like domain-containing protein [Vicinamibacterales bacterium]|nr:carboxypeptidase regulatory-like domain-containing protein [Vicinamibacterales bacterium]
MRRGTEAPHLVRRTLAILACVLLLTPAPRAAAQGTTTSSISGVVKDAQGAVVPGVTIVAVHQPSGTQYEAVTQADGRFLIPGMRVGGPYSVTASIGGFSPDVKNDLSLSLGVSQDLQFTLRVAGVTENVTVNASVDPVFSTSRTGAATSISRDDLATLPTISGRINDIARLSPQYGGAGTFAGQDNRMNNITVDGAYFNNSFGLGGQPGDRTGVAPISLEAIEQLQVNVAPYDVRQGNFVGASLNTVTRSGTNTFTGSLYTRYRNDAFVGTEAAGQAFNPGTFKTTDTGEFVGGPIAPNKLFFFENFENQKDTRPLTTFTSNPGGAPATGNTTRVLASDLTALSSFLSSGFSYDTGPFDNISKNTPAKPFLLKFDYNLNTSNKVSFKYNQLQSSTDVLVSGSSGLGFGRQTFSNNFLNFQNSNYSILENIKSGIGEWNATFGSSMFNNFLAGYTTQDESRGQLDKMFPFVDILENGVTYTSFGSEPFTPANLLFYHTFQAQDSFTKVSGNHSLTIGGAMEKYHSDNSFYFGIQSAYVYNSLADFYADAQDYLAHPNRTTSPVTLNKFQVRYSNIPGSTTPPFQQLDVWYSSAYAQDVWRVGANATITGGVRVDVPKFGNTAFDNPQVDALTFRDAAGNPAHYNTGALPNTTPLWSPRVGFNWDVASNQSTQVRGGTGVFSGKPAYVWISNQIGNSGTLTGFISATNTKAFPFNPNPDTYKPEATGNPPASADVAVTDPDFKFPQTWRSNIAVDRRLGAGFIATGEFIYNRDVNGMNYINANLPAAQSAFAGADTRPRWTSNRINNAPGNQVVENIVLGNENIGRSWNLSATLDHPMTHGVAVKASYDYGRSKNTIDPGSIAATSWTTNPIASDPNTPPLAYSGNSPGHRFFLTATWSKQYFGFGSTMVSAFFDAHTNGNNSYIFSGDANGDGATSNDAIYIPRDTSEMNFKTLKTGGATFTPDQQAAAFEAYIEQDPYLSAHRGQYAERGAVFYPIVKRLDLSLSQGLFGKAAGGRHYGEVRLDITNFGNLLNHDWGVGQSLIQNRLLTSPSVDAQGRLTYSFATLTTASGPALLSKSFQTSAGISDVYVMMVSFRYNFN